MRPHNVVTVSQDDAQSARVDGVFYVDIVHEKTSGLNRAMFCRRLLCYDEVTDESSY